MKKEKMALDKQDLKEIKKIVDGVVNGAIEKSEVKMSDKIEFMIEKSKEEIIRTTDKKIGEAKEEIVARINREVSDLSDINRAAISRTDQIDYRLRIVERKLGIKA